MSNQPNAYTPRMKMGEFYEDDNGRTMGSIYGIGLGRLDVELKTVTGKDGSEYIKLIADPNGDAFEIGAAFDEENENGKYKSVTIDSPMFAAPLRAAIYPDRNDPRSSNMMFNRKKPERKPDANAKADNDDGEPAAKNAAPQPRRAAKKTPGMAP